MSRSLDGAGVGGRGSVGQSVWKHAFLEHVIKDRAELWEKNMVWLGVGFSVC